MYYLEKVTSSLHDLLHKRKKKRRGLGSWTFIVFCFLMLESESSLLNKALPHVITQKQKKLNRMWDNSDGLKTYKLFDLFFMTTFIGDEMEIFSYLVLFFFFFDSFDLLCSH